MNYNKNVTYDSVYTCIYALMNTLMNMGRTDENVRNPCVFKLLGFKTDVLCILNVLGFSVFVNTKKIIAN